MDRIERKLSASLEDYLEAIYNLSADQSFARSKDIAHSLQVSRASVTGALRQLAEKDLVNYKPYGYITLTEAGRRIAARIARRHRVLNSFFMDTLGLDEDVSQQAACKAEHALGPEIMQRLVMFTEFLGHKNQEGRDLAGDFHEFCRQEAMKG